MRACDYKIFRIAYRAVNVPEYAPHPGGEMERTGRFYSQERVYQCVAPTQSFADVAFARYHGDTARFVRIGQTEDCGALDDLVTLP